MEAREQRGVIIAATTRLDRKDGFWLVPSQSSPDRKYKVDLAQESCTCPDCEAGFVCKHIHAVKITLKRELGMDGTITETKTLTVTEKKTYRQDWPQYNAAQVNEKDLFQKLLHAICKDIKQPSRKPGCGRNKTLYSDILFAIGFKVYSTISSRRFMSDLRAAHEKGFTKKNIHFNCISRYMEDPAVTPILNDLVIKSSLPLKSIETDFAIDSTGFSTGRFVRWFDEKYGVERSGHDWVKVHLMCGVKTNVITSVEIHDRDAADASLFGPLVKVTARNFKMKEISADKAYLSERNIETAFSHGATPFIPFKVNSTGGAGGLFEKMFHYFSLNKDAFYAKYHKRSNIETTNHMIKAKFGSHVRSKSDVAMKNEALAKCLCHNICCLVSAFYELGIDPIFESEQAPVIPVAPPIMDAVVVPAPVVKEEQPVARECYACAGA